MFIYSAYTECFVVWMSQASVMHTQGHVRVRMQCSVLGVIEALLQAELKTKKPY